MMGSAAQLLKMVNEQRETPEGILRLAILMADDFRRAAREADRRPLPPRKHPAMGVTESFYWSQRAARQRSPLRQPPAQLQGTAPLRILTDRE